MFRLPTEGIAPHLWSRNEPAKKLRVLITIPTWNEEIVIGKTLTTLSEQVPVLLPDLQVTIEIADNGSTDRTREIVKNAIAPRLEHQTLGSVIPVKTGIHPTESVGLDSRLHGNDIGKTKIILLELHEKGKGMAIKRSWEKHLAEADVLVFMDADLAADIQALPNLVEPILNREADLVCGSRFMAGSKVERKIMREAASRLFNFLQKRILALPVKDAQCGFKAISAKAAGELLPLSTEETWLFDSELLALAVKKGYRIKEIPVSWVENRDPRRKSAVRLWKHGWSFLLGLAKIRHRARSTEYRI